MSLTQQEKLAVRNRAQGCCEYCRLPASGGTISFHVDHIISVKHGGSDDRDNLCLACYKCNAYKGSNVGGFDPETGNHTLLYHPRRQQWDEHFELKRNFEIVGRTPEGRTTLTVLRLNDDTRLQIRQILADAGQYPCANQDDA
jgi:hypothetical protein